MEIDNNIRIVTEADLTGVQAVQKGLMEIRQLAQEIGKSGISLTSSGSVPQTFTETAKQRAQAIQQSAVSGTIGAQAVRSSQPTGIQVGEWMQQNLPIINAMMGNNSSASSSNSRVPRPQRFVARPGTIPTPRNVTNRYREGGQGSSDYIRDWFLSVERNLTPGSAAHDEWHSANQSWIQGDRQAPETFYRRHAAEQNMVPVPTNPSANVNPRNSLLGNVIRSALPARGLAGTIGEAIGGIGIGGLALGGLAAGAVGLGVNSFGKFMDSGDALSELTKQILSTKDSLETLQKSALPAGAAMAMNADMTSKVANTLGTAFGSMSLSGLRGSISQVGGMGLAYGVSPDVLAKGFAGAASLGVTTGPGSTMNQGQLAFALANSAAQSGMSGRMTELLQELLTVTQSIQSTSVTSNPTTLLGIISAMNGNLPRSMQGAGGAEILNQINGSMANPNSLQQIINYQAMSDAGTKGFFNIMRSQQMGPGYTLPNGKTNIEAIFGQYNKLFGGNTDEESYFLQKGLGISIPQADELLKIFGNNGVGMSSIQNNLGISPNQLKDADWNKLALFGKLNSATTEEDLQSVIKEYSKNGGVLSDAQKAALENATQSRSGPGQGANESAIDRQKRMLAQDILNGSYSTKTTTEQVNTLTATVTNAQITVTGKLTNPDTDPNANVPTPSLGGNIIPNGIYASYTPGGYGYSPNIIATAVGMGGMNNAFAWLSSKGNTGGNGSGIITTGAGTAGSGVYHPVGNAGAVKTGNNVKDFMANMGAYAQQASSATGLPTSFILAQWGNESAWGTSQAAEQNLNFAGIKPFGGLKPGTDSMYAGFNTIDDFVKAYVNTINSPRYEGARNAAANGADAKSIGDLLHQEGYAEASNYGSGIAGFVGAEAKELNLSDASLAKLSQAIINALNSNNWKNPGYITTS